MKEKIHDKKIGLFPFTQRLVHCQILSSFDKYILAHEEYYRIYGHQTEVLSLSKLDLLHL